MNLVRCENGHFYDADIYTQCPHCSGASRNDDVTVGLTQGSINTADITHGFEEDTAYLGTPSSPLEAAVQSTAGYAVGAVDNDATVGYYDQSIGSEPVVGWLVCVEGNNLGQDFRLKTGRNFIGRGQNMDVVIAGDDTVSREKHAIVVYEPKTYVFLIQAGDSKELSYLNDNVVLNPEELKTNDIITVGNTKLMFFPCCGEKFNWEMLQ